MPSGSRHATSMSRAPRLRVHNGWPPFRAQRDRQLRVVEENASKVSDAKIVKMRQSELAAIQDKFDRLIAQHERAVTGSDLITKQLATALLEVEAP